MNFHTLHSVGGKIIPQHLPGTLRLILAKCFKTKHIDGQRSACNNYKAIPKCNICQRHKVGDYDTQYCFSFNAHTSHFNIV